MLSLSCEDSGADDAAFSDRHAGSDDNTSADPDVVLNDDRRRHADGALATLHRIHGVTGAADDDAWRDEHSVANVHRRCVEDHAVVIEKCEAVKMDVEAVIALKTRHDADRPFHGAEEIAQDLLLTLAVCRIGLVKFPAEAMRLALALAERAVFSDGEGPARGHHCVDKGIDVHGNFLSFKK